VLEACMQQWKWTFFFAIYLTILGLGFMAFLNANSSSPTIKPVAQAEHIYVIGNGPILASDHNLIAQMPADWIYRFNGMNNLQPSEPVGNVFVRQGKKGFWGLGDCRPRSEKQQLNICPRISEAKRLILVGSFDISESFTEVCAQTYPKALVSSVTRVEQLVWMGQEVNSENASRGFSTGFVGLVHVLDWHPPPTQIHIFGMNWELKSSGHDMAQEKALIEQAPSAWIKIHATRVPVAETDERVRNTEAEDRAHLARYRETDVCVVQKAMEPRLSDPISAGDD